MPSAPIEKLPVELLQPIFFLSGLNLSLPAASPHIASKLADDYIYNAVCEHYLTTHLESRAQQTNGQTRLFASRWMTWDYFKSFVLRRWGWADGSGCLCGKTPDTGCFDAQWPPNFADATTMLFSRSHLPQLTWVKGRIPAKLLHGPWTKDKMQFLRFLLWTTGMNVDWASPEIRKLVSQGKKEAILTGNLEVVEIFDHNRRLGNPANLDMIRFAVMDAGCNRSIVYDMMAMARQFGLRGEGWQCAKLDEWCEARIQEGDPKGTWLQMKLKELRTGSDGNGGYMDPSVGDYDDVEDDKLVVSPLKWNEPKREFGWIYGNSITYDYIHGLGWDEIGQEHRMSYPKAWAYRRYQVHPDDSPDFSGP